MNLVRLNPLSAGRSFQTPQNELQSLMGYVLIPYQQGGLFRHDTLFPKESRAPVLIPYQQGGLFRRSQRL